MFSQNSNVENTITKVMILGGWTIGKWLSHEGRAHMNGIRALVKEAWNTCSYLLFRDMSWKRPSLILPCWHPDVGLLAYRTVINSMADKPPSLCHFVTEAACTKTLDMIKWGEKLSMLFSLPRSWMWNRQHRYSIPNKVAHGNLFHRIIHFIQIVVLWHAHLGTYFLRGN